MKLINSVLMAAAATLLATSAQAAVKGFALNPENYNFSGEGPVLVPLKPGVTSMTVKATKPTLVVITYSAECAVGTLATDTPAQAANRWLNVDLVVNGVAISPTNGSDAFCSGNATPGVDGWFRASVSTTTLLPVGNNTVQVRASLGNGGTGGWLSDRALVVNN